MKSALVWCSSVDPAGGMERVALGIANGLAERDWRVVLAGPFARVEVLRKAIAPVVQLVDHRPGRSPFGMARTALFLRRIAREKRIQVVSAHGSVFPVLGVDLPVVWTEHDVRYAGHEMLSSVRGWMWRRVRGRLRHGRWHLVAVSQYVREEVARKLRLPDGTGRVIYNGLPNAAALAALPPPALARPFQLGFLGRLVPSKRPLDVFEISMRLNQWGVPHVLRVFGDGVLLPQMRKAARERTGHSVTVEGLAEKAEDAFARMDLLLFLARGEQEGLGMVLIEALAARRLVVAWDAGCIREVLGPRAALVPAPFSLDRFAQAVAAALSDGGRPANPDDERWSQSRMITDYETVLNHAIQSSTLVRAARGVA